MQNKNKKNLYKIVFITILLGFIISLVGCNWLSFGLLNIFDPQAQIRVNYNTELPSLITFDEDENISTILMFPEENFKINIEVFSLNQVEFTVKGFSYDYSGITYSSSQNSTPAKIPKLSRIVETTFYVEPSPGPGTPGPISQIGVPIIFNDVVDYLILNPLIIEILCDIYIIGEDGSGHEQIISVGSDIPIIQLGIDFISPTAIINVTPGTAGTEPFTVIFDAYDSTDNRGIASYAWDFGDGTTATGVMPAAHTYTNGEYIVKLTVTDYYGNVGIAFEIITVGEAGAPTAVIEVTPPSATGDAPFTVYFDASDSSVVSDCGACSIVSYAWNFGDGDTDTGMTTEHEYTVPGTYNVILTVTDSNGNTAYDSVTITVTESGLPSSITIQAVPTLVTSATGSSAITVTVKDASGNPVPDGTDVTLLTTFGTLSSYAETTLNGVVTTVLTFSAEGSATVTAISGSINNSVVVTCAVP